MTTDNLTVILNKLHAMNKSGVITLREIAESTGTREQRVQEWITRRIRRPNGEMALRLQSLAANISLRISKRPALCRKYRSAFRTACMLFPMKGGE